MTTIIWSTSDHRKAITVIKNTTDNIENLMNGTILTIQQPLKIFLQMLVTIKKQDKHLSKPKSMLLLIKLIVQKYKFNACNTFFFGTLRYSAYLVFVWRVWGHLGCGNRWRSSICVLRKVLVVIEIHWFNANKSNTFL